MAATGRVRIGAWAVALALLAISHAVQATTYNYDVVVYESTPGGIMAAVAAGRRNMTVAVVAAWPFIGGMCAGGLGKTDTGNTDVIGGYAHEFFARNGKVYGEGGPEYTLEPHVARDIFMEMMQEANVDLFRNQTVDTAETDGTKITSFTTLMGDTFNAKVFVDASYEGDLLARAGASYFVGREGRARYNESLGGNYPFDANHEFETRVDPYDENGNLIAWVSTDGPGIPYAEDKHVQSYNFRLCVTKNTSNLVPFTEPEGYDPKTWELARRFYNGSKPSIPSCNTGKVPNDKYDMNNCGPVSTDLIGGADEYPEANYSTRMQIWKRHKDYMQGLFWFLSTDESLPEDSRKAMQQWGYCKDEFVETGHWPWQLYVREARRLIGDEVFTQNTVMDNTGSGLGSLSIGMGSYNFDTHNAVRYVCDDPAVCTKFQIPYVFNEGDVETHPGHEYQIPVSVILPKKAELTNLLVPVCVSASHVGYATLRLEPQYMIMGHAAGVIATHAVQAGVAVHDVNMTNVAAELDRDGAIRSNLPPTPTPTPANCTYVEGYDYDHKPYSYPASSQQECCDICAGFDDCAFAIWRHSGSPANTCWPGTSYDNKVATDGVSVCQISK